MAVFAGTLLSVVSAVAGADAEVLLNRQWAEQAFSENPAEIKPANRLVIARENQIPDSFIERERPIIGGILPDYGAQVMDDVATANNQDAFSPQGSQFPPQGMVKCRLPGRVEAELNDGDVSLGKHLAQN